MHGRRPIKSIALNYEMGELSLMVSELIEEVETMRTEAQSTGSEAKMCYIANFHLTEVYSISRWRSGLG